MSIPIFGKKAAKRVREGKDIPFISEVERHLKTNQREEVVLVVYMCADADDIENTLMGS